MKAEKDRYRTLTAAAVLVVAGIAAAVSYVHVASLALRYGQPDLAAYLLPVSIDGLVATSSVAMLRSARSRTSSPWLARTGLVVSVGATIACNLAYGLPRGPAAALLSAWPGMSFVIAAEIAISMSRPSGKKATKSTAPAALPQRTRRTAAKRTRRAPVTDAEAEVEFMDELAAGTLPSLRQIRSRLHVGQDRAKHLQAHLRTLTPARW